MFRPAINTDFDFLRGLSERPPEDILEAQIRDGRLRIIESHGSPIGFLKFCVLWETLPFIELLFVIESQRGCGNGRKAVRAWESEMARLGFDLVLTSTQADESAQHFWRKLGYLDCGALAVRNKPSEIFMQRKIENGDA